MFFLMFLVFVGVPVFTFVFWKQVKDYWCVYSLVFIVLICVFSLCFTNFSSIKTNNLNFKIYPIFNGLK